MLSSPSRRCPPIADGRTAVPSRSMSDAAMRAVWYERVGAAPDVRQIGERPIPEPGPGEVRVRVVVSGLTPTDVKSRAGSRPMGFPRIVPHQDGAGVIDAVGPGVPTSRVGEQV